MRISWFRNKKTHEAHAFPQTGKNSVCGRALRKECKKKTKMAVARCPICTMKWNQERKAEVEAYQRQREVAKASAA